MIHKQAGAKVQGDGFWSRLAIAMESLGDSYAERLEKRVQRLEIEMSRLLQNEVGKAGPEVRDPANVRSSRTR